MATTTNYATGASGTSWTTPTNANANDTTYATYTIAAKSTTGNVNTLTNFGFDSSIPSGSTINSVQLEVEHKVSTNGGIANLECTVAISGTPGTYNTDTLEPTTDTARTYATLARPGGGSWTRADLLDGTFTVLLRARSGNNATSVDYSWDYARVTVDYTPAQQDLTPGLFSDTNTFHAPTVTTGAVTVTPDLFSNTNTFYDPTVTSSYGLTADLFSDTNTFFTHTIVAISPVDMQVSWVEFDTMSTGASTLLPSLYSNTNSFYAHTVTAGSVTLTPDLYSNTNTFYTHTVTAGSVTLTPGLFSNTNSFYAHTVTAGSVTLTPSLYSNTNTFYTHTVTAGSVTLTPALYSNSQTFYGHIVTADGGPQYLVPDLFTGSNAFYTHVITPGSVTLLPGLYSNDSTFFTHLIANEGATLTADYIIFARRKIRR